MSNFATWFCHISIFRIFDMFDFAIYFTLQIDWLLDFAIWQIFRYVQFCYLILRYFHFSKFSILRFISLCKLIDFGILGSCNLTDFAVCPISWFDQFWNLFDHKVCLILYWFFFFDFANDLMLRFDRFCDIMKLRFFNVSNQFSIFVNFDECIEFLQIASCNSLKGPYFGRTHCSHALNFDNIASQIKPKFRLKYQISGFFENRSPSANE